MVIYAQPGQILHLGRYTSSQQLTIVFDVSAWSDQLTTGSSVQLFYGLAGRVVQPKQAYSAAQLAEKNYQFDWDVDESVTNMVGAGYCQLVLVNASSEHTELSYYWQTVVTNSIYNNDQSTPEEVYENYLDRLASEFNALVNIKATAKWVPYDAQAHVETEINPETSNLTIDFYLPRAPEFEINRNYSSTTAMYYDLAHCKQYDFCIIDGNVEVEETARLYMVAIQPDSQVEYAVPTEETTITTLPANPIPNQLYLVNANITYGNITFVPKDVILYLNNVWVKVFSYLADLSGVKGDQGIGVTALRINANNQLEARLTDPTTHTDTWVTVSDAGFYNQIADFASRAENAESNASISAGTAAASASLADGYAQAASDSADAASDSADAASDSADAASSSAGTASSLAQAASNSAQAASNSAGAASDSAQAASDSAQAASTSAQAASDSAQAASTSAQAASDSAQAASGSASLADGYSQSASDSADAASTSAQAASSSAQTASARASDASGSAGYAQNQANAASRSAEAAGRSAEAAGQSAEAAGQSAQSASSSASTASSASESAIAASSAALSASISAVSANTSAQYWAHTAAMWADVNNSTIYTQPTWSNTAQYFASMAAGYAYGKDLSGNSVVAFSTSNAAYFANIAFNSAGLATSLAYDASLSASAAKYEADRASDYATAAKNWAISSTNNNAKYWAQQANNWATLSTNNNAKYWASVASGSANDAVGYANAALSFASVAEAWAVGTVGFNPVTATGPYSYAYNNNAKYWANIASYSASVWGSEISLWQRASAQLSYYSASAIYSEPNVVLTTEGSGSNAFKKFTFNMPLSGGYQIYSYFSTLSAASSAYQPGRIIAVASSPMPVVYMGDDHQNWIAIGSTAEAEIERQKGQPNGIAELDSAGVVPAAQLPSYVDDVLEFNTRNDFPATGESGKIYIAKDTNVTYRWSGSTYAVIGSDLALGETSSTAYRGDRGATAYAHATETKAGQNATGLYKIATTSQGHVASVTAVTKSDITALGIPGSSPDLSGYMRKGVDYVTAGNRTGTSIGTSATVEGWFTVATARYAHAEGYGGGAHGEASHKEGYGYVSGEGGHAEGSATSTGNYAHAEGAESYAFGAASHSENKGIAYGTYSHAEGSVGTSINEYLTGSNTTYTLFYGNKPIVVGMVVTVDSTTTAKVTSINGSTITVDQTLGSLTQKSAYFYYGSTGQYSHTEGLQTISSGQAAHAEGEHTIANHHVQHTFGQYNIADPSTAATTDRGNYIEIVGNGTAENTRSNARTLDWSGNEWVAGIIKVGGTNYSDTNAKELATKDYVDSHTQTFVISEGTLYL